MKKLIFFLTLLLSLTNLFSQENPIYGSKVVIRKRDTSSAELQIINSTRNVSGFLKNTGGGNTIFKIPSQSEIAALPDSLLARYTKTQADARFKSISYIPDWLELTGVPSNFSTTYALSNDIQDSILNKVTRSGSYADPSWITSINYSKLVGTVPTWNQNTTGNAATVTNGVYTTGTYTNPAWIVSLDYSKLTGTVPTWNQNTTGNAATVTNGVYTTGSYANPTWITSLDYSKLTGTIPTWNQNTTGNAATVTNGVYTTGSYADPSWITSLGWSKISGAPAFITGINSSMVTTALGYTPENISNKGIANGYADLDAGGKIPASRIDFGQTGQTFVVASQAAMLAVSGANIGALAVRTDESKNYRLIAQPASTLGNWQLLLSPDAPVQSVNGYTGNVNLLTTHISEGSNYWWTAARSRAAQSLTTTGNSGSATYDNSTGVLNVPTYTLAGLGGISLSSLSFTPGSGGYNSATGVITIPTNTNQLTNGAEYISGNQTIILSGVITGSGSTAITTSIAAGAITNTMLANGAVANLSGTNTGDNAVNSLYSGLVSNATHTGDATGATALTVAGLRGVALPSLGASAGFLRYTGTGTNTWIFDTNTYLTSYTETDPTIYAWAKAATKPSYAWSEITSKPIALSAFTNDLGNYGGWITGITAGMVNAVGAITNNTTGTAASLSAVLDSSLGGAGSVSGILKANGLGVVSAAVAGDITSLISGTYLPIGNVSGTTNYIPKFTGSGSIGNSRVVDNFGIGLFSGDAIWFDQATGNGREWGLYYNGTTLRTRIANSDALGFSIASTGQMTLSSQLNGTSLSMSGGGSFGANTTINTASGGALILRYTGNTNYGEIATNAANELIFKPNIIEAGRFASDGTFLINTTTPEVGYKLIVNGGVKGTSATFNGADNSAFLTNSTGGTGFTYLSSANTGGNIFVGVARNDGVFFASGGNSYAASIGSSTNTDLQFATNNTVRLTIATSGAITASSSVTASSFAASGVVDANSFTATGVSNGQGIVTVQDQDGRQAQFKSQTPLGGTASIGSTTNHDFRVNTGDVGNTLHLGRKDGTNWLSFASTGAASFISSATASGFIRSGSSDSYFLLGGGGHVATSTYATVSSLSSYATTASLSGYVDISNNQYEIGGNKSFLENVEVLSIKTTGGPGTPGVLKFGNKTNDTVFTGGSAYSIPVNIDGTTYYIRLWAGIN